MIDEDNITAGDDPEDAKTPVEPNETISENDFDLFIQNEIEEMLT
jgi:hypothetical protein